MPRLALILVTLLLYIGWVLLNWRTGILLVLGLLFGSALADLSLPTLMANIVNLGVAKANVPYIFHTGVFMLAVALGGISCALVASYTSARVALGFARTLRLKIFTRVESYSFHEFDQIGTASLITRTTNDVNQVQQTLSMMLGVLVRAPIMGVGGCGRQHFPFHAADTKRSQTVFITARNSREKCEC